MKEKNMEIFDITPGIFSAPLYSGDPAPELKKICAVEDGCEYNLSSISMGSHTGAHIDAPLHFVENGKPVDALELEKFIGKCTVVSAAGPITAQWVERNLPWNCRRLLIKCGGNGYLMNNAVYELCRFNLELIGIDSTSIASPDNESAVHRELMYNEIALLEGIELSSVKDGEYFLFAPPIKVTGAEAAPCRAVLIKGITD
ncbi:MAG: cyclase family protein [Clostridiales bacterium]|nr:cyclase family protein [Clostridiales bacterium]